MEPYWIYVADIKTPGFCHHPYKELQLSGTLKMSQHAVWLLVCSYD